MISRALIVTTAISLLLPLGVGHAHLLAKPGAASLTKVMAIGYHRAPGVANGAPA